MAPKKAAQAAQAAQSNDDVQTRVANVDCDTCNQQDGDLDRDLLAIGMRKLVEWAKRGGAQSDPDTKEAFRCNEGTECSGCNARRRGSCKDIPQSQVDALIKEPNLFAMQHRKWRADVVQTRAQGKRVKHWKGGVSQSRKTQ